MPSITLSKIETDLQILTASHEGEGKAGWFGCNAGSAKATMELQRQTPEGPYPCTCPRATVNHK